MKKFNTTTLVVFVFLLFQEFNVVISGKHQPTEYKDRIVQEFANSDLTLHKFCKDNNLAYSTVSDWVERYIEYGTTASNLQITGIETRGRNPSLTENDIAIVFDIVANDNTKYFDEIAVELAHRGGTNVHPSTIKRFFNSIGMTRKKVWKLSILLFFFNFFQCNLLFTTWQTLSFLLTSLI